MLPAEPKAEADNTCRDLDYSGYHKKIGLILIPATVGKMSLHCTLFN